MKRRKAEGSVHPTPRFIFVTSLSSSVFQRGYFYSPQLHRGKKFYNEGAHSNQLAHAPHSPH